MAIALLPEHVHECIVTLTGMNKRPSMVERTGEVPFTVLCTERSQSQLELWQSPLMELDSPSEIPHPVPLGDLL